MSGRFCETAAKALQRSSHELHEEAARRLRHVAELAPRYLAQLLRRHRVDPEREALLEGARARLRLLHGEAARLLPRGSGPGWADDLDGRGDHAQLLRRKDDGE